MKMMRNKLLILIASIGLISCVSTNIPKSEKKAKKRLSKHLKGIDNILTLYPDLTDTLTVVEYDTIIIEKHDIDTSFIMVKDTAMIDKLLFDFLAEPNISEGARKRDLARIRTVRNEIIKEVLKDTTFIYEDSLVHSTFIINGGKFYYKSIVKEQKKPFKTEIINSIDTDCNIRKNFFEDWKFWILLLIILILGIIRNKKQ